MTQIDPSKDEMLKDLLESQESTYFSQYLVATQSEDLQNQVKFILKQTDVLVKLNNGEQNIKVCSNLFLTAQLQLKLGMYADALSNN